MLSSNNAKLLQEPFFIPQLSLPYAPAPLLDARPSCHRFLALTPTDNHRMDNASRALAAATGITPLALLRAVSPEGLPRELLLAAAGAFKVPPSFLRLKSHLSLHAFHHTLFNQTSGLFKPQRFLWVSQHLPDFLLLNEVLNHLILATVSGSV